MSALGQKPTFAAQKGMFPLPPKADIAAALSKRKPVPYANSVSQRRRKPERELREKQNKAKPY